MATRAVVYARQSKDRSGDTAAVTRQVDACQALATARGWTVADVVVDNDTSASTGRERPGYTKVLGMVRAGAVDRVIAWHFDRLARRMTDLEQLIDLCETTGVRVATVTGDLDLSTDTGRLLARILASVARGEVERKGARQRAANQQRREAGHAVWSRRPFGYDRSDGRVVVVEREAAALRFAAERVIAGATLASVTRELEVQGVRTSVGMPFTVTGLRRVLLNPRVTGAVTHLGQPVADAADGQWPTILHPGTQEQVRQVLADPRRRVQQGTELKYLLSGTARCGVPRCGGVMYAGPATSGRDRRRWYAYRCRAGRGHNTRRMDLVDEVVVDAILARLALPDAAAVFVPDVDLDELRARAVELRNRRDGLARMLTDGLASPQVVRDGAQRITGELREVEARIAAAEGTSPVAPLVAPDIDVRAVWAAMDVRAQRGVVDALVTVTILPGGRGARFDQEKVQVVWR